LSEPSMPIYSTQSATPSTTASPSFFGIIFLKSRPMTVPAKTVITFTIVPSPIIKSPLIKTEIILALDGEKININMNKSCIFIQDKDLR